MPVKKFYYRSAKNGDVLSNYEVNLFGFAIYNFDPQTVE